MMGLPMCISNASMIGSKTTHRRWSWAAMPKNGAL